MKKIMIWMLICGVCVMLFNACSLFKSDESISKNRSKAIKKAIDNHNISEFEGMFAANISIDNNGVTAQDVMNLFPNGITYKEGKDYGVSVTDWTESSNYVKMLNWDREIVDCVTGQTYVIIIEECVKNWNDKNEIGMHLFLIYNINDEDAFLLWWRSLDDSSTPTGIYYYKS